MNEIEKMYIDRVAKDPSISVLEVEQYELSKLEESIYFVVMPQKPKPPLKVDILQRTKNIFGESSTHRKEFDNHAPEYLKSLDEYYTALKAERQTMHFMGKQVVLKPTKFPHNTQTSRYAIIE